MAQRDFKEADVEPKQRENGVEIPLVIQSTDVMTGDKNKSRFLLYQLKMSMKRAKQIDMIVSFLMESGVRMILDDLKEALDRGVSVRILTAAIIMFPMRFL